MERVGGREGVGECGCWSVEKGDFLVCREGGGEEEKGGGLLE